MPVRLPPGRARLATRPSLTGSSDREENDRNCRGCRLDRERHRMPPDATITATCRRTSSAARAGSRSIDPRPNGIRPRRSRPRRTRSPSGPGEMRETVASTRQANGCRETRSPALRCCARATNGIRRRAAEDRDELPPSHSITSSARASRVGGTLRLSAFAVLRLITSSNLVGCWTGRSAGFSPLRMRST